jgi:hypothetical protein
VIGTDLLPLTPASATARTTTATTPTTGPRTSALSASAGARPAAGCVTPAPAAPRIAAALTAVIGRSGGALVRTLLRRDPALAA